MLVSCRLMVCVVGVTDTVYRVGNEQLRGVTGRHTIDDVLYCEGRVTVRDVIALGTDSEIEITEESSPRPEMEAVMGW